jgi:hypothetical protein
VGDVDHRHVKALVQVLQLVLHLFAKVSMRSLQKYVNR